MQNLLPEPPATRLPADDEVSAALLAVVPGGEREVAAAHPASGAAWAALAELSLKAGDPVAAYAYARTGYHRGLDQLRRAGWKGFGPVPWDHRPNQGVLRALGALALAAREIGEDEEWVRCSQFLADSDPKAPSALGLV